MHGKLFSLSFPFVIFLFDFLLIHLVLCSFCKQKFHWMFCSLGKQNLN